MKRDAITIVVSDTMEQFGYSYIGPEGGRGMHGEIINTSSAVWQKKPTAPISG